MCPAGQVLGWTNFGDLIWSSDSPCSLHYDWTYSMLLHYIRSGKRNFFDTGVEMAKHRYDIDQYHGARTSTNGGQKLNNYLQFYETTGHGTLTYITTQYQTFPYLPHVERRPHPLLSAHGDRKAFEAAKENGEGSLIISVQQAQKARTARPAPTRRRDTRAGPWSI